MRRSTLIKAVLTLTFAICTFTMSTQEVGSDADKRWETLICAISAVESSDNPNARSKNGQHVGILQISPCVVDDCNKICGKKKFSYSDRTSREKSIEMFNIYQNKYNPTHNLEKALRVWNGGPNYTVNGTNGYVKRVMRKFNQLIRK